MTGPNPWPGMPDEFPDEPAWSDPASSPLGDVRAAAARTSAALDRLRSDQGDDIADLAEQMALTTPYSLDQAITILEKRAAMGALPGEAWHPDGSISWSFRSSRRERARDLAAEAGWRARMAWRSIGRRIDRRRGIDYRCESCRTPLDLSAIHYDSEGTELCRLCAWELGVRA